MIFEKVLKKDEGDPYYYRKHRQPKLKKFF